MNLYPSILTDSLEKVQKQLDLVKNLEEIQTVQIDIVDGFFVDNLTITPLDLVGLDFGDLTIDLHLMVEEPMDSFLEIEGLAEMLPIRAVIAQIERMTFQEDFLAEVKRRNWKAGLSLDLFTPLDSLDMSESCLQYLDIVQIMNIEAGFQGQEFNEIALEKLEKVKKIRDKRAAEWEIISDGGIKLQNYKKVTQAGTNSITVGSELWKSQDVKRTVEQFLSQE